MRFYFNFLSQKNDEILDCEGLELANWLAAHRHAIRIVKQTVPFMPEGPDWRGWRIQVTDESPGMYWACYFTQHRDMRLQDSKTGYIFVKREGQDGTAWVSLGGVLSPVATANP
jgi:hypothetical protein